MSHKSGVLCMDVPRIQQIDRVLSQVTLKSTPEVSLRRRHVVSALIDLMSALPENLLQNKILELAAQGQTRPYARKSHSDINEE